MSTVIKGSASGQINLNDTTGSIQLNGSDVLTIESDRSVDIDSGTLHVDATNNNVGIGTITPTNFGSNFKMLQVKGSDYGVVQATSTSGSLTTEMMASASVGYIGTRTNHPLVLRTNDTERMRIDSSGRVTMPYQPAFRVGLNTNYSHTAGNPVEFNDFSGTPFHNVGGHYNTSTYRFTAPVAGVYSFYSLIIWMSLSSGTSMEDSVRFAINGSVYSYGSRRARYVDNYTGSGGYYTESIYDTFKLNANDYVEVIGWFTKSIHGNQNYTYFTGHLIG